jgi:hypothetical protein
MKKLVLMMTVGVIFLDAGAAFAGSTPVRIPNPGTLVLFTTGIAGLAWWLRKRD